MTQERDIFIKIMGEIHDAIYKINPDIALCGAIGSFGDTLSDEEVLSLLEDWNKTFKPRSIE